MFEITLTSAPVSYNQDPSTPSEKMLRNGLFELDLLIAQISKSFFTFKLSQKLFEKKSEKYVSTFLLGLEKIDCKRSLFLGIIGS